MPVVKSTDITVRRYTAGEHAEPTYTTYRVPVEGRMTILQALEYVYRNQDSTLGFYRYCCGGQFCNSCRMTIDGAPSHSCLTTVEKDEYLLEPPSGYKVIRDLIVDWNLKEKKGG